jgi:hypothetical protein
MSEDFTRVLARIQTDYEFYVRCQTDPDSALEDYDLSPEERSTVADPQKLADTLVRGVRITISGTHDWVNRAAPTKQSLADHERDGKIASEVETIRQADSDDDRNRAVVRLMELVD